MLNRVWKGFQREEKILFQKKYAQIYSASTVALTMRSPNITVSQMRLKLQAVPIPLRLDPYIKVFIKA